MNTPVSVTALALIFVSFLIPCHVPADATEDFELTYVGSCLHSAIGASAIRGDYAYCVTPNGLLVIDISDAQNPVLVSETYLQDRTFNPDSGVRPGIAIRNNNAYIVGGRGLTIINIANIHAPYPVGKYNYSSKAGNIMADMEISGDRVYILGTSGVSIIDISDPGNPSLLGRYDQYRCNGLAIADTLAYIITSLNGLFVLNVTDPAIPTEIANYDQCGHDIVLSDTLAFALTDGGGLFILNMTDPLNPIDIANYETGGGYHVSLTVYNDLAYMCAPWHGIHVIDVSDPTSPALQSFINEPLGTLHIVAHDSLAYLSSYYVGLAIFDMSDVSEPSYLGLYRVRGMGDKMAIAGNYAYGISGFYLHTVNFSNPHNPYLQGVCTLTASTDYFDIDYPVNLAIDDTLLYVACFVGLSIVNISSPGSPVLTDLWLDLDSCWEKTAKIRGDYLYLAGHDLHIINISNSPAIFVEGKAGAFNVGGNVVIHGDYAYTRNIFDISDPAFPYMTATINLGPLNGMVVRWPYLFTAGHSKSTGTRLYIANVVDPYHPVYITDVGVRGAEDLRLVGDSAYVVGKDILQIYDIANPEMPQLAATADFGGRAFEIIGDYFYFGSRSGFVIATTSPETCGDINNDNLVNAGDVVLLINHIFKGGPPPDPPESADFDGSGQVNVGDPVYLLNYLFRDGPEPYCP